MKNIWRVIGVVAVGGLMGGACSSSSPGNTGSGGTSGTGGKAGTGGTTGSGGGTSTGGAKGSGGISGTGGVAGSGGAAGAGGGAGSGGAAGMSGGEIVVACTTGGAGGVDGGGGGGGGGGAGGMSTSAGGMDGGAAGMGGAGGRGRGGPGGAGARNGAGGRGGAGGGAGGGGGAMSGGAGMGGAAPSCQDFPTMAKGSSSFTLSSAAFGSCMPIPAENTCDQKPFPQGTSPALTWTAGPAGTMSYAIVLKDLSVLARYASTDSNYNKGFHYVMWDIPANVTSLPANMKDGFVSTDVSGALQWSNFNDYGYFGPCPNYDPMNPTAYDDSYAFLAYALPAAKTNIPAPQAGISTVRLLDGVLQANALAIAEYRGTSSAAASALPSDVLPPKDVAPCPTDGSVTCGCVKRAP